jgi:hypothetical protein
VGPECRVTRRLTQLSDRAGVSASIAERRPTKRAFTTCDVACFIAVPTTHDNPRGGAFARPATVGHQPFSIQPLRSMDLHARALDADGRS